MARKTTPEPFVYQVELANKTERGRATGNLWGVARYQADGRRRGGWALQPQADKKLAYDTADELNAGCEGARVLRRRGGETKRVRNQGPITTRKQFVAAARADMENDGIEIDPDAFKKAMGRLGRHIRAKYGRLKWEGSEEELGNLSVFYDEVLSEDPDTFNRRRAGFKGNPDSRKLEVR